MLREINNNEVNVTSSENQSSSCAILWSICGTAIVYAAASTDIYIYLSILSGQVLYVPRHWWHYVESVDPITVSVNSWIELVRIQILPEIEGRSSTTEMSA